MVADLDFCATSIITWRSLFGLFGFDKVTHAVMEGGFCTVTRVVNDCLFEG